jgi:hypothetical protein
VQKGKISSACRMHLATCMPKGSCGRLKWLITTAGHRTWLTLCTYT